MGRNLQTFLLMGGTAKTHGKGPGCRRDEEGQPQSREEYVVVQSLSCVWLFAAPWTAARQAFQSFTILCSNSCPLSQWCCPIISSSVTFFSCPQPFPALWSFPRSQLYASGGQTTGASASVFPINIQGWFPCGLIGLISLLSPGTLKSLLQHHSLKASVLRCSAFLWSNSHISLWPHGWQHARLPCPSLSPGVCSNSCSLSWWCHLIISSQAAISLCHPLLLPSVFPSFKEEPSLPSSASFPMSQWKSDSRCPVAS